MIRQFHYVPAAAIIAISSLTRALLQRFLFFVSSLRPVPI